MLSTRLSPSLIPHSLLTGKLQVQFLLLLSPVQISIFLLLTSIMLGTILGSCLLVVAAMARVMVK